MSDWTWDKIQRCQQEYDAYRVAVSSGDRMPLRQFLWHVTVDAQPQAKPFHQIARQWQIERIARRAPMVEAASGRLTNYVGPRCSWETWPRGHDKTGETARMCVWFAAFAGRPVAGTVVASDEEQAKFLRSAALRTIELNPWIKPYVDVQADKIVGSMGIVKISGYDPSGSYGATDDLIVCDELTWWKSRDLFDALLSGLPKRREGCLLVTTNAGVLGTWQHDLLLRCQADPLWSVYESPEGQILADWMSEETIQSAKSKLHPGTARRVWENVWIDQTETPLLTLDEIDAVLDRATLWTHRPTSFAYRPRLYIGVDIGRTNDKTVIWTLEEVDEYIDPQYSSETEQIFYTREVLELSNCPFHEQRRLLEERLTHDVIRCSIDQGSIGYELAEDFYRHYPHQVERVQLNSGRQGQLAVRVREMVRAERVRLPARESIRRNFSRIQAVETSQGGLPIIRTPRDHTGHCDEFWAFALALGSVPTRPVQRPVGTVRAVKSRHATSFR